ncbi:hypothetical protein QNO08_04810 [Arthrobacter sp. zg-Y820]|uniref:hypothetical protein n=1 Tax=unclassified Arthrobacter TaxID=235627 RepID=UPI001E454325|nr:MULTISPECIES: hypothetical protein [unclassified Arthrobacter]MCC9198033.1 hypothetical protein [Arthrobacter sp. zg-Y820]MDK1280900.1 hypothetical protein [Arthrobacter sp. zg.Y820]WIB10378.1 hypothetical protein QNO08_04810 [Arthrobacter sp. zg-Y820]
MNKKQVGAAPAEENLPEAGLGWFARLRVQPGFRTAAIAFILTVVLGLGGTAAYAWWSQSRAVSIVGTTGYALPVPSAARCVTASPNRVEWSPAAGVDPEAKYILTFQSRGQSVSYAVPLASSSVEPSNLPALREEFGATFTARFPLTVTMRTAIVVTEGRGITRIGDDVVARSLKSEVSTPLQMFYSTTLWTNYPCS